MWIASRTLDMHFSCARSDLPIFLDKVLIMVGWTHVFSVAITMGGMIAERLMVFL